MKKLNLNVANLGATEILSREELKKVLGGTGTGTGSGDDNPLQTCTPADEGKLCVATSGTTAQGVYWWTKGKCTKSTQVINGMPIEVSNCISTVV